MHQTVNLATKNKQRSPSSGALPWLPTSFRKHTKTQHMKVIVLIAAICFGVLSPEQEIYARSSGSFSSSSSGGFKGSSSSSSSFRPSTSSPSKSWGTSSSGSTPTKSWGSSSSSTPTSSTNTNKSSGWSWGSSTKTQTPKAVSATGKTVDQAAYKKAVQSGNVYKTKDEALSSYKEKNAAKFKNTFDSEPSSRPTYIPSSTNVGGTSYNVSYNPQFHGYGYYGPSGSWMMYDTIRDVAMLSMLMDRDNVVVAAPPTTVVSTGHSFFFYLFTTAVIIIVIVFLGMIFIK